jgi:CheY-like chemotaxis protein
MASKGCILLIDDDWATCEFIVMALTDDGYTVVTAANGQEALDCLRIVRPELILLDLSMPVMNGPAFLQTYRALANHPAPVVILSAVMNTTALASVLQVDHCLLKPFDLQDLLDCVQQYFPSVSWQAGKTITAPSNRRRRSSAQPGRATSLQFKPRLPMRKLRKVSIGKQVSSLG